MNVKLSEIEGIPFQNALIIENNPADVELLTKDLKSRNISVILTTNSDDAECYIKNRIEVDLVILDWLLDEENDTEAKSLLKLLKTRFFAPIIIYTDKGPEGAIEFLTSEKLIRITTVIDKAKLSGNLVFKEVEGWLKKNPELKIFLRWACEVKNKVNNSLWEIHDLDVEGLNALIDLLDQPQGESTVPKEQEIINLFDKVLSRKLNNSSDEFFCYMAACISELRQVKSSAQIDPEKLKTFHRFERYKLPIKGSIQTGDILRHGTGGYSIVVTPSCDLCHPEKIEKVILVNAEPFDQYRKMRGLDDKSRVRSIINNTIGVIHYLPYVIDLPNGLLCRFDNIFSIKLDVLKKEIEAGNFQCIETIDSPFIEYLIQRMNAYLMRLGVRDLADGEIKKISDENPVK